MLYQSNTEKLIGQKALPTPQEVWAIRALFNLAIDSNLRGYDLVSLKVSDVRTGDESQSRAKIIQHKTGNAEQFEITNNNETPQNVVYSHQFIAK